jgi:hypothetical protein
VRHHLPFSFPPADHALTPHRWFMAGRLWDVLIELSNFGDVGPAQFSLQRAAGKRARPTDGAAGPDPATPLLQISSPIGPSMSPSFDHSRGSSTGSVNSSDYALRAAPFEDTLSSNTSARGMQYAPVYADPGFAPVLPNTADGMYQSQVPSVSIAHLSGGEAYGNASTSYPVLLAGAGHGAPGLEPGIGFGDLGQAHLPSMGHVDGSPSVLEMLQGVDGLGPTMPGALTSTTWNLHGGTPCVLLKADAVGSGANMIRTALSSGTGICLPCTAQKRRAASGHMVLDRRLRRETVREEENACSSLQQRLSLDLCITRLGPVSSQSLTESWPFLVSVSHSESQKTPQWRRCDFFQ